MPDASTLAALVRQSARAAGFDLAGIAPVDDFAELAYFPHWIEAGRAGEMHYMGARDEQGNLKRASLRSTAPWARSVVVCAINYNTAQPYSTETSGDENGWISRYAWSREDYHDAVLHKLRTVEKDLREALSASADLITRCYVDTGPIVERVYAKYAGIGWIGKNACVINQKLGSWLFLGVMLTSADLEADLPAPDRCGSCTRCIEACPTNALLAPYQMDATRCISYLTIEKRGEIPEPLRGLMGRHVFGCDICQDVCPWNQKAARAGVATLGQIPEFHPRVIPPPDAVGDGPDGQTIPEARSAPQARSLFAPEIEWIASLDEDEYRRVFRRSPVKRAKYRGLIRNACVALGNSGSGLEPAARERIVKLLGRLAESPDALIAEHARWALDRLVVREATK